MNNKGLIITASSLLVVIVMLAMYIALWADDVAYDKAVAADTSKEYKAFLDRYPDSEFAADIRLRYDKCDYLRVKEVNREDEFNDYIKEHPKSLYVDSVKILVEVFAFNRAQQSTDPAVCRAYIKDYSGTLHAKTIQKRVDDMERQFYNTNINVPVEKLSRENINQYHRLFPDGKLASKVEAKSHELSDYNAYNSAKASATKYSWQHYLDQYPKGKYASIAKAKIREYEEREYYLNNSLSNGSQPYASKYGWNYSNDYGRAMVRVNASSSSDVVVIVRYNNSNGRVAGHAYIRRGCSYTIYLLPERRYQVFFYYGKGWYPKKEMPGGVKGGFLTNESFDKDGLSRYFDWGEGIEYTLTERVGGNFSTSKSSESEIF